MSEKSVAQLVAEIKAKVHDIDAHLNAIEVVNPKKNLALIWESVLMTWDRLKKIPDDSTVEMLYHDKNRALFDLRVPLNAIWSYVQLLLKVDETELGEALPPQNIQRLQIVDQIAKEISDLINELEILLPDQAS